MDISRGMIHGKLPRNFMASTDWSLLVRDLGWRVPDPCPYNSDQNSCQHCACHMKRSTPYKTCPQGCRAVVSKVFMYHTGISAQLAILSVVLQGMFRRIQGPSGNMHQISRAFSWFRCGFFARRSWYISARHRGDIQLSADSRRVYISKVGPK